MTGTTTEQAKTTVPAPQSGGAEAPSFFHEQPVCAEPLTETQHLILHLIHLDPRLALHRHRLRLRVVAHAINRWLSIRDIGRALMKLREHRLHGLLRTRGLEPIDWDRWQMPDEAQATLVVGQLLERTGWQDVPRDAKSTRIAQVVRLIVAA